MALHYATPSVSELVKKVTSLASFPDVVIRINELLNDDVSTADDIGKIIQVDPALTATILRVANTPMYNVSGGIDTVERALTVIGLNNVRDIAFGVSAALTFKGISNRLITVEDFWRHSLYCALSANYIAKQLPNAAQTSPFTCGLLHDIGQLVMFNQCPELSRQALIKALDDYDGLEVYQSENLVFGYDHAEVGGALAEAWGLPPSIVDAIRYHHQPMQNTKNGEDAEEENSDIVALIHLANCAAVIAEMEGSSLEDGPEIQESILEKLNITEKIIIEAGEQARLIAPELMTIFTQPKQKAS